MKLIVLIIASWLLCSCIALPINRTYFEPNLADGEPSRSSAGGYHRTANDSLLRKIAGIEITIYPHYAPEQNLSVVMVFSYQGGTINFQADKVGLINQSDHKTYIPQKTKQTASYAADKHDPHDRVFYDLIFPVNADDLDAITFVFPEGVIRRDSTPIAVAPFRFTKVKKHDFYYGTLN